jgi:hypothetical protein
MAAAHQILMGILARAAQVAHGLVFNRRRMHLGQQSRTQQLRQLARVTTIGLDPIARLARDQRRRHHHALGARLPDPALQRVAAGTRFVTEANLAASSQTLHLPHHPPHRRLLVRRFPLDRLRRVR